MKNAQNNHFDVFPGNCIFCQIQKLGQLQVLSLLPLDLKKSVCLGKHAMVTTLAVFSLLKVLNTESAPFTGFHCIELIKLIVLCRALSLYIRSFRPDVSINSQRYSPTYFLAAYSKTS